MLDTALQILLVCGLWLCPLPLCSWIASQDRRLHRFGHDALVVAVGLLCSQMTLHLLLGAMGWLRPTMLYATEAILAAIGLLLLWRRPTRGLRCWPGNWTAWEVGFCFVFLILFGASLWRLVEAPTSNHDSLAYHLPAVVWWAQAGEFRHLPELGQTAYYAFDWELNSLLPLFVLHNDLLLALPNLLVWFVWGLALVLLARELGASKVAALCAMLLLLGSPGVLGRLDAAQPDIALAAFFTAALYLAIMATRGGSVVVVGHAALCLLLLPGLKLSGGVHLVIAGLGAVLLERLAGGTWWRVQYSHKLLLALLTGLLLGLYWYGRNWALSGNPLGFVQVELLGRPIFAGAVEPADLAGTTLGRLFEVGNSTHWGILARGLWQEAGPGVCLLGALASFGAGRGVAVGEGAARRQMVALSLCAGLSLLAYIWAPYSADNGEQGYRFTAWFGTNLRFAYPFASLLCVVAALALSSLRLGAPWLLGIVTVTTLHALSWKLEVASHAMIAASAGALALCSTWSVGRTTATERRIALRLAAVILLAFGFAVVRLPGLQRSRERLREEEFGRIHTFLQNEIPDDAVVAYAHTHRIYPLFGNRFTRTVVGANPAGSDFEQWLQRLRDLNVQYLAVGTANAKGDDAARADARAFVTAHTDRFELVFPAQSQRKDLALYRLR